MLTEIPTPNRIAPNEIKINLFPNGRSFTPYGVYELAKQLVKWAAEADSDIKRLEIQMP